MHKFRPSLAIAAIFALLLGASAPAAFADSSSGVADMAISVVVVRSLIIVAGESIQFGLIEVTASAGSVTLDAGTGTITIAGGVVSAGPGQPGSFVLIAPRPGTVEFTFGGDVDLVSTNDPKEAISFSPASDITSHTISADDEEVEIKVGGTLNFAKKTKEGVYNGTFSMMVNYI